MICIYVHIISFYKFNNFIMKGIYIITIIFIIITACIFSIVPYNNMTHFFILFLGSFYGSFLGTMISNKLYNRKKK